MTTARQAFLDDVLAGVALAVLLFALAIPAHAQTIEGPNIPSGPFLIDAGVNCQPIAGGEFTKAWLFVRRPVGPRGPVTEAFCQYHATDLLPGLPLEAGTNWAYALNTCVDPTLAAVSTRWQLTSWKGGGGDGGCDEPGPAPTPSPLVAMARAVGRTFAAPYRMLRPVAKKPTHTKVPLEFGHCHMDAGKTVCLPDAPATP